jgi:hypothetical protein
MGVGRRRVLGAFLVVVLAAAAGAAAAANGGGLGAPQQSVDADTVSLRVGLAVDGSADWRVTYRVELDTDNETAAFEDLSSDVETDPAPYVDRFASRMQRAMWTAENATGREMAIENVSVDARTQSLPQGNYGVVTYRLAWRGFAAVAENGTVTAGDAIDELFLDERTSLSVAWPDEYGLVAHEPTATAVENGSVTWQGRRDFGPGEPRVVVAPGAGGETPGAGGIGVYPILIALALFFAVGGWLYYHRDDGAPSADDEAGAGASDAGSADAEADPPAELLSNEERVLHLLEAEGGRLKQQQVAAELDWTDAKTSQVVSDLREAGDVESFRLGRENVLTLPDVSIEPEGGPDAEDGE